MSRKIRNIATIALVGAAASVLMLSCSATSSAETNYAQQLEKRSAEFERDIIQVSDNVYTAIGYGVSAVSMIVGEDGIVIVDTGVDTISGDLIRADFRNISDKTVKAIILTHGHGDHTGGISSFLDTDDVEIWASEVFGDEKRTLELAGVQIQKQRGAMQAGFMLKPEQRINNGVAQAYWPKRGGAVFEANKNDKPNNFLDTDRKTIIVAGVTIDLVAAGGETKDQLYVWLPKERVAFSGDNFYKSFPNLYAIRGTGYRDILQWADAVDSVLNEGPASLVGGHTRPIIGESEVKETLTNFRDAIRFVFEKTVEGINKGLTPNQLVDYVQLPEKYQNLDYLQPYYGNPEWAIRSIFNGYLGWFDGNATNLFPLSDEEEAKRIVKLSGGMDALLSSAADALSEKDFQWAAQLYDYVIALEPDNRDALLGKADALTELTNTTLTTTARNYYQSSAQVLRKRANN